LVETAHRAAVLCHDAHMTAAPAPLPEIPPIAAVQEFSRSVANGGVRLDPAAAEQFQRELIAIRDEVAIIRQDARFLVHRVPQFGANPTGRALAQKFVDRANDFTAVLQRYHQVLADMDSGIHQAVTNWTRHDQENADWFRAEGPR